MKTLVMKFLDAEGNKKSLSVRGVKDSVTAEQAQGLMDTVIEKNIFIFGSADVKTKDSAYIVDTQETELF